MALATSASTFSALYSIHPNFSVPSTFTSFLLLATFFFLCVTVYRVHFHPLAAIPGPWYAAVSDFWLTTHVARLQQCTTIQSLFEAYGPVVRIGPNKIAFCDVTSMRSVYCIHKFEKSTYYKSLLTNDNDHAMTTLPNAEHAARRKPYAPHYSQANLALFQSDIHDVTVKLTDILGRIAGKASVDCLDLFRHFSVDVLASTNFGSRPESLDLWAVNMPDYISIAVNDFPKRGVLRSAVPTWAWNLISRIPSSRWRQVCASDKIMAQFVSEKLYLMRAKMLAGKAIGDIDTEKMPLLQRLLQHRISSASDLMSDQNIVSEAMGHLVAGVDSSSTTISYFLWELSRRPDIVAKLQREMDDAMPDRRVIPDISVLSSLPYLNAFIKEGLRLYGAAPSLLERVVPQRTASPVSSVDGDFDLMGYALPPGTIVSTQAWSMHRSAEVFPSPETFLPERWLSADNSEAEEERLASMAQHMMPFGAGPRICGGQGLAQVVLKIVVATMVRNFDIKANPSETNERTMAIKDAFITLPAALECKLSFSSRPQ
ncbi:hypothetical protein EIP91_003926 [Steccherinum ochraceum]|uniref:Cytochrome P450-dit2 n=1 Tax=Steccherinum ochraceum TaxID=92696 RepID=A0A4V2MXJ0_9APHY|nr:hypothetical protein EIP91_003926 [Steccherinum ochraceum]